MLLQICEPDAGVHTSSVGCAIGIDLGTTHTVVAYTMEGGKTQILPLEEGHNPLVPSVVFRDGQTYLVGHRALEALQLHPEQGISSVKRMMSPGPHTLKIPTASPMHAEEPIKIQLGDVALSPAQVSAQILLYAKKKAETYLKQPVTHAVITVPAFFDDKARQATREAAHLAGIQVLRLLNEPTSAALAYGLDQQLEGIYAVYDLGGGTFDISILKLTQGVFQVLATGGDTLLGGDDFDGVFLKHWRQEVPHAKPLTEPEKRKCLPWIRQARHVLSFQSHVTCPIPWPEGPQEHRCDQATLDLLIEPLIYRTLNVCQRVLRDSALDITDIQGVVLVGGATRTPLVRKLTQDFFGCPVHQTLNPDEVVALGASLQAHRLTHGSEALLLDVTPLSLGIETMGKLVDVVIPRNTPIPIRQSQWYTTYKDNQEALAIHVVQGEAEEVSSCRSLGSFELHGIPPMPAGQPRIQVIFEVDADGVLIVTAREQSTGQSKAIPIRPYDRLSFDSVIDLLQKGSESPTTGGTSHHKEP